MIKGSQFCVAAILACGLLCGPKSKADDQQPHKKGEVRAEAPGCGSPVPQITFETRILKDSFRFFDEEGQKKGPAGADFLRVGTCVYKPLGVPMVNATRPNCLFLPEWFLRPGGPRDGSLWREAFFVKPEKIPHGVRIRYPDEALAKSGVHCTLDYTVKGDMIGLDGFFEATRSQTNLEVLIASYLPNRLNATYAPAGRDSDITWKPITSRVEIWKSAFWVCVSPEVRGWRRDGRVGDAKELGDWSLVYDADWPYAAPILVDIEEASGLAAILFVDDNCTVLTGQYHPNDTAHDFAWGWRSLSPGQKIHARAVLWITQLQGSQSDRMAHVYKKYLAWRKSWAK